MDFELPQKEKTENEKLFKKLKKPRKTEKRTKSDYTFPTSRFKQWLIRFMLICRKKTVTRSYQHQNYVTFLAKNSGEKHHKMRQKLLPKDRSSINQR